MCSALGYIGTDLCICSYSERCYFSVMAASVPLLLFAEEDVEGGGKSIEDDFSYKNNVQQSSIHIRMGS